MKRRTAIKSMTTLTAAAFVDQNLSARMAATNTNLDSFTKGRINHSACRWCYSDIPLDEFALRGKQMGLQAIDLLTLEEVPAAQKVGLTCSMLHLDLPGFLITKGFNNPEYHKTLWEYYEDRIPKAAKLGLKNFICFSGNRYNGLTEEAGIANCIQGLRKLMPLAEKHGITLCMELLNSRVDHPGYQCDTTNWGAALVRSLGSENFKLLFDIYHMQIMEGDIIATIKKNMDCIAHFHTGGVPGRHEIDETQELNYAAIMRAIAETGFQGFTAQEFIPTKTNKLESLEKCLKICEV
jgi:hydroxypyruvate isomerase